MDKATIDDTCEFAMATAVKPILQRIIQVQETGMAEHPEGSHEYNQARLEWSKANAALFRANGDTLMQEAYLREVRHYQRLVDGTPRPTQ